jgi:membrane-associated phospholipid phosphatase
MRIFLAVLLALHILPATAGTYSNLETSGDAVTAALPVTSFVITYLKDDPDGRREFLRSNAASLVLNTALRVAFNQTYLGERPNGNRYGFPSGHVAFITTSAAFLQDRYGWKYGVPAYLAAGYVSWVRLENHHHRSRDVIAGAAVSIAMSKLFVTPFGATTLAPIIGPEWMGIRIERSF